MLYSTYEQPKKKHPILIALAAVIITSLIVTLILIPAFTSKPITSYPMGTNNAQPLASDNINPAFYITNTGNP